ncbi:putative peptidoglycan glycosyltransferase FtsW [Acinetobacter calcoaceticus]|uniref:Probable peptidoglycan glycosyltransferase FtsW n=1 Tax=Acinetobacter calcoaceticus DSM 30006 = CIP 81.8 TaxID=981331 RepID=A0ABP2UK39_ACICA|nr:putative lipid II flippase FtsW [Acinetobacter calcoaceticus]EEY76314.1 cell division protein FtsW [Acinetobacter calcoaceticus RUH2202]ENW01477.1 cell division protein FtsW [Acinetobacter calcoaceticus DSM 30006 = CIP 81.8]WNY31930.1 putative lipid II flippase FtsW [Acinetobacter calcoaceticus]CAI3118002.1 putative peptidoglycan glycosyltransferase FtsW [Acinetobacter calcoaceticus]CAI3122264.1 putative peptidoglycan glycosyltransferase FtsW [Acinetobacter calcoaceticus]
MAGLAQTTIQKINHWYERILPKWPAEVTPRNVLIFCVVALLCIGSVMVASASMPYAEYMHENPFHYVIRHGISIVAAAVVAYLTYRISLNTWFKNTFPLWLLTMVLLLAALVVGSEVNGSTRWIKIGGFTLQPTEVAKVMMAIFTADYVVRRAKEVRTHWKGLLRLSGVMAITVGLIIAEPDLGATIVIVLMMVGVFFLAGAPPTQFLIMLGAIVTGIVFLILFEPYRFQRLISFTDPWADPLGVGYQLSNALMAFGRGEWFGTGLGHSVQKLSYLPEAHTDFMLAVLGEEFGFFGISIVIILSFSMLACCIKIGHRALKHHYLRAGYLAYGISIIFLLQILVNAGMNMGLMPTKGLTLPFISYGGTSLMMCAAMISLILKIDASTQEVNPEREESNF